MSDAQGGKAIISLKDSYSYKEYFYLSNLLHLTYNTDIGLLVIGTGLPHTNLSKNKDHRWQIIVYSPLNAQVQMKHCASNSSDAQRDRYYLMLDGLESIPIIYL